MALAISAVIGLEENMVGFPSLIFGECLKELADRPVRGSHRREIGVGHPPGSMAGHINALKVDEEKIGGQGLEELDDVQNVYSNADLPDSALEG
jgi:hypothetical protein